MLAPVECPNCGLQVTPDVQESASGILRSYWQTLVDLHVRPAEFFRKLPSNQKFKGGLAAVLAFALVTHWLGAAIGHLWDSSLGTGIRSLINPFMEQMRKMSDLDQSAGSNWYRAQESMTHWFSGVGTVIVDPFLTLAMIFITSAFVFAGARILVPSGNIRSSGEVTYQSIVKIVALGMTPAILAGIPLIGSPLSALGVLIVTVIGIRETYQISNGRSLVIVLFPKLLFLGIILMGLLTLFASLVHWLM